MRASLGYKISLPQNKLSVLQTYHPMEKAAGRKSKKTNAIFNFFSKFCRIFGNSTEKKSIEPSPKRQPRDEIYWLKMDLDFEIRKFDLFRTCESKIDELGALCSNFGNVKITRCQKGREQKRRKLLSKIARIDGEMREILLEIADKQSELKRLTDDGEIEKVSH